MKKIATIIIILFVGLLFESDIAFSAANENLFDATWYQPKPGTTWYWQLQGRIKTNQKADVYDIDLFDVSQKTIDELHQKNIKVICYFSAGSWEKFRPDAKNFPKEIIGKTLDGWANEKWLDISQYKKFADIIRARMDLAVKKKCDGVEPDNVDGFQNKTGFKLTPADQLKYNRWLAYEAHKRNLSIALKNDLDQVNDLVDYFDFAINEQCFQYKECDLLKPFIEKNKAVFGVEYELNVKKFCTQATKERFSWAKTTYDLNGKWVPCSM